LIFGGAYKLKISPKFRLLTSIDLDMTFDGQRNVLLGSKFGNIDPHWGFELVYNKLVYLRGGLGNYQRATDIESGSLVSDFQPTIGLGLRIKKLRIDYALTDIGDQSVALYSNVFSIRIDFEQKKDRR